MQIVKIVKERDASSVALKTYVLTVSTLWVIYGAMTGAWPVTIANAIILLNWEFGTVVR